MTDDRRATAKLRLLQLHHESHVGHIGGNLSSLDILLTLYHDILSLDDRFILSKGHAAGALYVALWSVGRLEDEQLKEFHSDGTLLSGHPPPFGIPDVLFATGSLGHGLGLACGIALGKQLRQQPGRVFCLTSDGEWNEGSCWEALIFSSHRKLDNLVIIVDVNGLQGFGRTCDIANLEPLKEKFQAFGLKVIEVNGHDQTAIANALKAEPDHCPLVILAKTVKGAGISYMENRMDWHYLPMTDQQYEQAVQELSAS